MDQGGKTEAARAVLELVLAHVGARFIARPDVRNGVLFIAADQITCRQRGRQRQGMPAVPSVL
jgi:RimJ/RimL family protein N-acetyltransferase